MHRNSIIVSVLFIALLILTPFESALAEYEITDTIPVLGNPVATALSNDGKKLYVANNQSDVVTVIDTNKKEVVKEIPVGDNPNNLSLSPDGQELFVSVRKEGVIKVISTETEEITDSISAFTSLTDGIAFNPDGSRVYVRSAEVAGQINVSIIDTRTKEVVDSYSTEEPHEQVLFNSSGEKWYLPVINGNDSSKIRTDVIDVQTNELVGSIDDTFVLYISESSDLALGANKVDNTLDYLDLESNSVTDRIDIPSSISPRGGIQLSKDERLAYIANSKVDKVSVLDVQKRKIVEEISATGTQRTTLSVSPDDSKIYVAAIDPDVIYVINYDKKISTNEQIQQLIDSISSYQLPRYLENSYMAHVQKLPRLYENERYRVAIIQLNAFVWKLNRDQRRGVISPDVYEDLKEQATAIKERIKDEIGDQSDEDEQEESPEKAVPLVTQVDPAWADEKYAGGRADFSGSCGDTIRQCGCVLASMSMLGKFYDISEGIDGSNVDPSSMNDWLLENGGYTSGGSVLWNYVLAYLGKERGGKVFSQLSLHTHNETDADDIKRSLDSTSPQVGYSAEKGHYLVLEDTLENGYSVNDPLWFNTETTDDVRDIPNHVQDYNDTIDKAQLFTYTRMPRPLPRSVEIVLESPAELVVTNADGERVGFDPRTSESYSEIDGGSYDREDILLSSDEVPQDAHVVKRALLLEPDSETFTVEVIGTDEGEYTLTAAVTDGKGALARTDRTGEIVEGESHEITIDIDMISSGLPDHFLDILSLIPDHEQNKYEKMFTVIHRQEEKGRGVFADILLKNLVRYTQIRYSHTTWGKDVVAALKVL